MVPGEWNYVNGLHTSLLSNAMILLWLALTIYGGVARVDDHCVICLASVRIECKCRTHCFNGRSNVGLKGISCPVSLAILFEHEQE